MNVIRQSIITIFLLLWTFGLNGLLLWLVIAHFPVSSQPAPITPPNAKKAFSVNLVTLPTPISNTAVIKQKKEEVPVKTVTKKKVSIKKPNSSPPVVIPKKSKPVVLSRKQHEPQKKPQKTISSSRLDRTRYVQTNAQEKTSQEKPLASHVNNPQANTTTPVQTKAGKKTEEHLVADGQEKKSVVTHLQKKIVPPSFHAAYLQNPPPTYPRLSRLRGEEGKVLLHVKVNEQGSVETLQLNQSSGSARLDQAAYDTVSRWRFVPAQQGGESVSAWVIVPILFRLQ